MGTLEEEAVKQSDQSQELLSTLPTEAICFEKQKVHHEVKCLRGLRHMILPCVILNMKNFIFCIAVIRSSLVR
jgi:ABC-type dipeptide/oligopeptide/nickel transport system permease component